MIIEELTRNGIMEPGRLYESPYTDYASDGIDVAFPSEHVDAIVGKLRQIAEAASPSDVA